METLTLARISELYPVVAVHQRLRVRRMLQWSVSSIQDRLPFERTDLCLIVDDHKAIQDYRDWNGLEDKIIPIDWTGV